MTDANVVLGHLPPRLLGGEMELDVEAARAAVQTVADAMGLDVGRAGRRGDPRDRQREHGRRAAARLRAARPRPARLRARRLRRRGAAARERAREAHGLVPGASCPPAPGAPLRDRRPRGRLPRRVRADLHPAARGRRAARRWPRSSTALGERATAWLDGRGDPAGRAADRLHGGHALPPAGLRDPGRARPGASCGTTASPSSRSGSTALHEQLYGFRMPGTASEIVNLRAVGYGDVPKPELPDRRARLGATRPAPSCDEHEVDLRRRARRRRRSTTARSSSPATASTGRRS